MEKDLLRTSCLMDTRKVSFVTFFCADPLGFKEQPLPAFPAVRMLQTSPSGICFPPEPLFHQYTGKS